MSNSGYRVQAATLYVVATPIGNLGDITYRAVEVLRQVNWIAAEDTRHSRPLLSALGITTPMVALHQHNEQSAGERLLHQLQAGESIALISDAGTPLISDPGFRLVQRLQEQGIAIVPIPGPSALITALSVAGLDTTAFTFRGFLPAKAGQRRAELQRLSLEPLTTLYYESPHRIAETLADLAELLEPTREIVIARELTKRFETIRRAPATDHLQRLQNDPQQGLGEFVLIVSGCPLREVERLQEAEGHRVAALLARELPLKQAAQLASQISGTGKNSCYNYLLSQQKEHPPINPNSI